MKKKTRAWAAALCLLALAGVVGFSTRDSHGSAIGFHSYSGAAMVIGTGGTFTAGAGRKFLSIGTSGTDGTTLLRIGSSSLLASPDTIVVNFGQSYSNYFANGIDSLRILSVATGATVTVGIGQ